MEIHGAVLIGHTAAGGPTGPLGYPSGDLGAAGDGRGKAQWFERGLIWYSPTTGGHGVGQDARPLHGQRQRSWHPASPDLAAHRRGRWLGTVAMFEGGRIYSSTTTAGFQVNGVISAYLDQFGGPDGQLGYPLSELAPWAPPVGGSSTSSTAPCGSTPTGPRPAPA